jgi:hypothetical protein
MQVDRALAHVAPSPEWIVAEHQLRSINSHLRIWLNTLPASAVYDAGIIIVAGDNIRLIPSSVTPGAGSPNR